MSTTPIMGAPDVVVLYEDDLIVAVDKPATLLVHSDGTTAPTLTDLVRSYLVAAGDDEPYAQPVNRLDVDTTGIVLFSKDRVTQPLFDQLMAQHMADKRYVALVEGCPSWNTRTVDAPIARDRHDAHRMRVGRTGKPARSHVRVLQRRPQLNCTLAEVTIQTGRRHQIRVHLAHLGHPVVNDTLYGTLRDDRGLMLHACQLSFEHPITGAPVVITSCTPPRFDEVSAHRT